VGVDAAGDVLAGGFVGNVATNLDFAVLKLSGADGAELWWHEIDGLDTAIDQDEASALSVDARGDVLAAGTLRGAGAVNVITVVKLDGLGGGERWRQEIPSEAGGGDGRLLALDAAGNALAAGDLLGAGFLVKRAEALSARKLVLADSGAAGTRMLKLGSNDKGMLTPPAGTTGDPTAADAVLEIRNPITAESASVSLPAARWAVTSRGYRYTDSAEAFGPCTLVDLRAGRGLKARCKGAALAFSLDEASQQALVATLTLGGGPRYCLRFGGTILRDAGSPTDGGTFVAKDAPVSPSCALP
jgi:hypothetical protein